MPHAQGPTPNAPHPVSEAAQAQNARAWDRLARQQAALATPASDAEFRDPRAAIDPLGWLGKSIENLQVLCLAAGGGRQSALYAAAGARVTVVDLSGQMLALDRQVASERGLEVRTIQTSMETLSMLDDGQFDLVVQPVSSCYVQDIAAVFQAVARVTRPGGLYVSQHKSPTSLQTDQQPTGGSYRLSEPYYRVGPLPAAAPGRLREAGTLEYLHRIETLLGGMCRAGFVLEDVVEPLHADASAAVGTFGHRAQFVAPYLRVKARRGATAQPSIQVD